MQIKPPSYLHYGHRFCPSYINYLKARNHGKTNIFNWYGFFFNLFWLIYNRMYKEAAIFIFILLNIAHISVNGIISLPVLFFLFSSLYFLLGFFSFSLYEKHCDLKFWENRNKIDIYNSIKPYSFLTSCLIFIIFVPSVFIIESMMINKLVNLKFLSIF